MAWSNAVHFSKQRLCSSIVLRSKTWQKNTGPSGWEPRTYICAMPQHHHHSPGTSSWVQGYVMLQFVATLSVSEKNLQQPDLQKRQPGIQDNLLSKLLEGILIKSSYSLSPYSEWRSLSDSGTNLDWLDHFWSSQRSASPWRRRQRPGWWIQPLPGEAKEGRLGWFPEKTLGKVRQIELSHP